MYEIVATSFNALFSIILYYDIASLPGLGIGHRRFKVFFFPAQGNISGSIH